MNHPFLVGEKLYLRGIETKDIEGPYFDWMNNPEVVKYMDSGYFPNTIENMHEYIKHTSNNTDNILLAIVDRKTDRHIGNVRLGPINWIHRNAFIGIMIGEKDFWGKGYGSEALKLVTEFGFRRLNLHKIKAGVNSANKGSVKAFEKAGYKIEGTLKSELFADGIYHDGQLLALWKNP